MNAGEPIRGVVAHLLVDRAFEHGSDRAARAIVHAIVELEVADIELRFFQVAIQRIEGGLVDAAVLAELGIEPLERFEVVALLRVVNRLAEIPVARSRLLGHARLSLLGRHGQANQDRNEERFKNAHAATPFFASGLPPLTTRQALWFWDRSEQCRAASARCPCRTRTSPCC